MVLPIARMDLPRFLLIACAFLFVTVCEATFLNVHRSHNDDTITNSGFGSHPPPTSPQNDYPVTSNTQSTSSDGGTKWGAGGGSGIDFLVAAFFLIAAGWLVLALIYSILVLIVVRLRARGQLDVYDEEFGRLYLLGTRWYIPFGCVLRRYVIAMTHRERNRNGDPVTVRLMTREERRLAMEKLLDQDNRDHGHRKGEENKDGDEQAIVSNEENPEDGNHIEEPTETSTGENDGNADDASEEEPVCTICLVEYEPTDDCFTSSVCSHKFHRSCILEWLQRRANTECPCCRTPLVTDEQVWETVQEMRQERRRQLRKANRGGLFSCFRRGGNEQAIQADEATVEPTPPPSPSPTILSSFSAGGDEVVAENVVANESVEASTDLEAGRRLQYE